MRIRAIPFMGSSDSMLLLSATERPVANVAVAKNAIALPAIIQFFTIHTPFKNVTFINLSF